MPNALDAALATLQPQAPAPQGNALDRAIALSQSGSKEDYNPATGGSTLQVWNPFGKNFDTGIPLGDNATRILEGVGGAYTDIGLGVRQLGARVADAVSPNQPSITSLVTGQPASRVDALRQEVREKRQTDAPLQATTGGKVGNIVGNVALAAPTMFIPGVNTYTGAALVGGGLGLLQPSESNRETATNVGFGIAGGLVGQALANGVSGLVRALRNGGGTSNTPGQREALDIAERLGFQVTPAQRTGSKALSQVEATLESFPESSGPFNAIRQNNERAMGRVVANAIGENADNVSSEVMGRAYDRLGNVFDSVADQTPVALDPQHYGARMRQVLQDSEGMIGQNGSLADNGLFRRLDDFVNNQGGATREQLRDLSSKLGKAARNNLTSAGGDRELGIALGNLQNIAEDAIHGTLSGPQAAEYAAAREQYRNLMNLTARNTIVNPSSGNVNGRALANALMSKDKAGFTFGQNGSDLYDAARFAQAFPAAVADSGTATRTPFSVGQIPTRVLGGLGSRWYFGASDILSGAAPRGVPASIYNAATVDPMAIELARLLTSPAGQRALPVLASEAGIQGQKLVNAPQQ
jgi:hypothetical protein